MRYMLSLGLTALVLISAQSAVACDCAPPPPPKEALKKAQAVFLGKVIKVEKVEKSRGFRVVKATFEASTNYKGVKTKQVEVWTSASGASCGYGFVKGSSHLVYCYHEGEDKKTLWTDICTRTRPKKDAAADIAAIGPGNAVKDGKGN